MSSHIDEEQLPEKYKTIWINIEDLQNVKLNALPVRVYIYKIQYMAVKSILIFVV